MQTISTLLSSSFIIPPGPFPVILTECKLFNAIATGSALAAWCKLNGELDWAKTELMSAELEMKPCQIRVFDIGKYLEELEDQVAKGKVGKSMRVDRSDTKLVSRDNIFFSFSLFRVAH